MPQRLGSTCIILWFEFMPILIEYISRYMPIEFIVWYTNTCPQHSPVLSHIISVYMLILIKDIPRHTIIHTNTCSGQNNYHVSYRYTCQYIYYNTYQYVTLRTKSSRLHLINTTDQCLCMCGIHSLHTNTYQYISVNTILSNTNEIYTIQINTDQYRPIPKHMFNTYHL